MATKVRRAVTIAQPRAEVYRSARAPENLVRCIEGIASVTEPRPAHLHWVVRGPAETSIEWDTEIVEDRPGENLIWRTTPDSPIQGSAEIRFIEAPADRGTEVHVRLTYERPAGDLASAVGKVFGRDVEAQVRESLRRFKQLLETGEIATTAGQPAGASALRTDESRTKASS